MNLRATQTALPQTHIVDMTVEAKKGNLSIISELLYASIVDRLEKDEQVILLLNRRGYNNFMLCRSCGGTVMCQNCDISLTYHKRSGNSSATIVALNRGRQNIVRIVVRTH